MHSSRLSEIAHASVLLCVQIAIVLLISAEPLFLPATSVRAQEPSAPAESPTAESVPKPAPTALRTVEDIAAEVKKSLVVIKAASRDGGNEGLGTGFVIDSSGLVVTARHVIGDGRDIIAELPDGKTVRASEVHASSSGLDLAVVRIPETSLPPLKLGLADLITDGRDVVALGHPRGFKYSVVSGVISGRRDIDGVSMIQLAMPIEPGNSGGPIVDREGRVLGIVTMKSTASDNVGFALPVNLLSDLLSDPNPVPIDRWLTIGALDPLAWKTLFGANWRQRAGRITVDGTGTSFGGRSLCLSVTPPPTPTFECQVSVRLKDERGAAGLVFHSDGEFRHYGFYPSAGNMRLTRFDGPDLESWTILHNAPHPAYRDGDWNLLKVRIESGKIVCSVNGQLVVESADDVIPPGKIGLASFRGTTADFRNFAAAETLPSMDPDPATVETLRSIAGKIHAVQPAGADLIQELIPHQRHTTHFFEKEAVRLEKQAAQLRQLAADVHLQTTRTALLAAAGAGAAPSEPAAAEQSSTATPDLLRAALLIARLDNEEVDVDAYLRRVDQMAGEIVSRLPSNASDADRLAAMDRYLFQENGFRGSRFEYYTRSNSYLNEVIDDREGLPITLSVLYIALAERLHLKVVGVGLPGHFVVRYEPSAAGEPPQLIDPFEKGLRLTTAEAEQRLLREGIVSTPQLFESQSTSKIIQRMLMNLLNLAEAERKDQDVLRYLEILAELAPEEIEYRAKRLEIRARTGRVNQALEDVDWFIENRPEGALLERLQQLRMDLEKQRDQQN